jgi:hypothetical protein
MPAAAVTLAAALLMRCADSIRGLSVCLHSYLQGNQFTGKIPSSLGSLSSLQQLCAPVCWQ